jgi:hypothetical protein
MQEGGWTIVGTIGTLLVLGITFYSVFVQPARHRKRRLRELAEPVTFVFVIRQGDGHQFDELVLPANEEVKVNIGINPKIFFKSQRILFGCDGDLDRKPYPTAVDNEFVLAGRHKSANPDSNPAHSLLASLQYQIVEDRSWIVGSSVAWGFRLKTRAPGVYPTALVFHGEEVEGVARATIRVVDDPSYAFMRCVRQDHPNCMVRLSSIHEYLKIGC